MSGDGWDDEYEDDCYEGCGCPEEPEPTWFDWMLVVGIGLLFAIGFTMALLHGWR